MLLVIKRTDGVSIKLLVEGEDVDDAVARWRQSCLSDNPAIPSLDYVSHRLMPDSAHPGDKTFRNAWCDVTPEPVIDVDMVKARNVWRDKMRRERKPLLEALDIEMTRAYNDPIKQGVVEAKRQALRDVTDDSAIGAAATPDQLKAVWPKELGTKR